MTCFSDFRLWWHIYCGHSWCMRLWGLSSPSALLKVHSIYHGSLFTFADISGCSVCTTDLGSFMTHIFREGDHTHDVLKCGKQYGGRSRTLVCRHHTWSGRRRTASARNLLPSLTSLLTASQGCLPTFRGQQRQMAWLSCANTYPAPGFVMTHCGPLVSGVFLTRKLYLFTI